MNFLVKKKDDVLFELRKLESRALEIHGMSADPASVFVNFEQELASLICDIELTRAELEAVQNEMVTKSFRSSSRRQRGRLWM